MVKASGETVPEVHGVDKELDPHVMPEQQYVSKENMPKGARPKVFRTPDRESAHTEESERNSVRIPKLTDTAKTAKDSPMAYVKIPHKSPKVRLIQPRTFRAKTPQKGDSNGESIDESDVDLTKRRHNLDIDADTGEGQEILDPEIKIPEESDFYEPEPLEQVVDVKKQWYKFLPKQGDVDKILTQINHKILRDTKLPLTLKDLKAAYLTSVIFPDWVGEIHTAQSQWLIQRQ